MKKLTLTSALIEEIGTLLESGVTIRAMCQHLNIGESTYYVWLQIGNAIRSGEDHPRIPDSEYKQRQYVKLVETATRATSQAHIAATAALQSAFSTGAETREVAIETFEETRLRKVKQPDGTVEEVPYTYKTTRRKKRTVLTPPDWRAAVEFLKRRASDEWSEKSILKHETEMDELIADIRRGLITPDDYDLVEEEFGANLAAELFKRAGVSVEVGTDTPESGSPADTDG